MDIKVEWTGKWPNFCRGEWKLYIEGNDKLNLIPPDLRKNEMGTFGIYSSWSFGKNWEEIWTKYEDGMKCNEWIEYNKDWLDNISTDPNVQEQLFYEFQVSDWRHGSCGGCI